MYHVPDTVLSAEDTNKKKESPCSSESYSLMGMTTQKSKLKRVELGRYQAWGMMTVKTKPSTAAVGRWRVDWAFKMFLRGGFSFKGISLTSAKSWISEHLCRWFQKLSRNVVPTCLRAFAGNFVDRKVGNIQKGVKWKSFLFEVPITATLHFSWSFSFVTIANSSSALT